MKSTICLSHLLVPALLALSLAGPTAMAAEKETDFFKSIIAPKLLECEGHFDIKPYFKIAFGGVDESEFTPEVIANVNRMMSTGKLQISAAKAKDPQAQKCATYAEGLIIGSTSYQIGQMLGQAVGDAMAGAMKNMLEGVGKALSDGIQKGLKSPTQPRTGQ